MTTPIQNSPIQQNFPILPPNTIVPENKDLFNPYLNRLYEDVAYAVNGKDNNFYPMAITDTAQDILNVPRFGAFILCVSGIDSTLPTATWSLCKSTDSAASTGTGIVKLGEQAGSGAVWNTFILTVTSTATNFQIAHNNTGISGNFNIRIIGTQ